MTCQCSGRTALRPGTEDSANAESRRTVRSSGHTATNIRTPQVCLTVRVEGRESPRLGSVAMEQEES